MCHSKESALLAVCGCVRLVNKVERLCVMSDEKGMEANRCHGVGHWEVRLTASTGSAKVQLHNIRQISKTAMERDK